LRVFLASPGDVRDERGLALRVLGRLQYDPFLRGKVTLEAVAWDHPGAGVPLQAGIAAQDSVILSLGKPSECDIVVVILWSRLGTPLPGANYAKPDGSGNFTGTEWEYEDAWQAFRQTRDRPRILLYRRTAEPDAKLTLTGRDAILQRLEQMQQVEEFFTACHARDGSFPNAYENPSDFQQTLEQHLKEIISQVLASYKPELVKPSPTPAEQPLWDGSPFPGLRAFTPKDAPIFFGRGRETDGLVSRLDNPTVRFLTVVGASGSGKSSLVAAGLIPRLLAGAIAGSQDWVWLRFTPGEVSDNPFMALALSFKESLQQTGQPPREVADRLEKTPTTLIELRDLVLAGKPDWAELLLFIDQFEELFTLAAPRYVGPFVDWLRQAAQTERIRVVATLQADFYHRCVEWPALAELLGISSYLLAAPGPGALYEMITCPAERAGLAFEPGLAERILDDTGIEPGSLALLAFALAELYNTKTAEGSLTWAAYKGFNGVQGAIAKRAEDTFNTLDTDSQNVLGDIFRELIEVDERGVATRRRASRHQVNQSSATEQLIDRFTNARLLVTSGEDEPTVEVAHEALLRSWPRLVDWIESVRDDLHLRSQLQRDAKNWGEHDYDDNYCWTDERVVATVGMLERLGYQPSELEQDFLGPIDPEQMKVLIDDLNTPAKLRGTIGIRLALLGDTRPGIGLRAEGLPDFRWASIPGTEAVRASRRFPNFTGFRLGEGVRLEIKAFELAIYPVTVAQFRPFVEQGGYQDDHYWSKTGWLYRGEGPGWWKSKTWTLPNQPVIGVSWYAVEAYCNWLNDQLLLPRGTLRLPTEAEWEWAARGPEGKCYPWGEEWDSRRCNSLEAGLDCTSAVGCFPGGVADWWLVFQSDSTVVYDLAGNVWEWTASEYSQDYSTAHESVLNTDHPAGHPCVLRGGSWVTEPGGLHGAARIRVIPHNKNQYRGFRLARTLPG
jgi:formylglycine-generating enzyme required for sulfatase activity